MYSQDDIFAKHLTTLPAFRALLRSIETRMVMEFDFQEPILDFGCGDGHFGCMSLNRDSTIGIDASISSLREADSIQCYRSLVQADDKGLPFDAETFNSALCNSVLEHIPNIASALSELRRVLKPECMLVFTVPSKYFRAFLSIRLVLIKCGLYRLARYYERFFDIISRHYHYYTPAEWKILLDNTGFKMESYTYYCSKRAFWAIEWGHYFGLPSLLAKKLIGKWILSKSRTNLWLTDKMFRIYYEEKLPKQGAYMIIVARHTGDKI